MEEKEYRRSLAATVGAIADRYDYFVKKGLKEFFRNCIDKYNSTVFRVNMPSGPPLSRDPRVIILLDANSFPVLFDSSRVEKKDVFTGVYTPSTKFTGGYRVLAYLDPSEEKHAKLKNFCFHVLKFNVPKWLPESCCGGALCFFSILKLYDFSLLAPPFVGSTLQCPYLPHTYTGN